MCALVVAAVGIAAAPASAASTTTILVTSPDAVHFSTPSPITITTGDSVKFQNVGNDAINLFSDICDGTLIGALDQTVAPTADTTYSFRDVQTGECFTFTVNVTATPPPAVPEIPYAAGLLGAAAVLFGAGFFILQRRATRAVA
jgi:hypothetical protein